MDHTAEQDRELDAAEEEDLDRGRRNHWIDRGLMLTEAQARAAWARAVENSKALDACPGPHDFAPLTDPLKRFIGGKWKCRTCGGEIDSVARIFYQQGLKHGRAPPAQH
jgi:hypothetical protein